MFTIILLLILGVVTGLLLRRFRIVSYVGKLISVFIYLLLLFLGISVGKDSSIMNSLASLGLQALIITLGALAGSILLAWGLYRYFFISDISGDEG